MDEHDTGSKARRGSAAALLARRENIARMVIDAGSLSVDYLAKTMGVSAMTIYRDVTALEEQRMVTLVRGDVYGVATALNEASAQFRMGENTAVKEAFTAALEPLIARRSSVMLDDSTSAIFAISKIAHSKPLTIITNSLLAAQEVESAADVRLNIVGGSYQKWAQASCGSAAIGQIKDLYADACVVSASGIASASCYHPYREIADVKRAMLDSSDVKILVADSSKFLRRSMHRFASLRDFDYIVTDSAIGVDSRKEMESLPAEIIVV